MPLSGARKSASNRALHLLKPALSMFVYLQQNCAMNLHSIYRENLVVSKN